MEPMYLKCVRMRCSQKKKMIKHSIEETEEMNMPIIESNRRDNNLFAEYDDDDDDDDDDFDLDDKWRELTDCYIDIDTEDVIDKIDDVTDGKIEDMIEEEQEDKIEDNKERAMCLDKINK